MNYLIAFLVICIVFICLYITYFTYRLYRIVSFKYKHKQIKNLKWCAKEIGNLDHDIFVPGNLEILENGSMSGWDATVGPSPAGWPMYVTMTWNYCLYKDIMYYYLRVDYHEKLLWWTFDDPYFVCKIPKEVVGDLVNDRKLRMNTMWEMTDNMLHTRYERMEKWFPQGKCEHINGHSVKLGSGGYECTFEKYLVICNNDGMHEW